MADPRLSWAARGVLAFLRTHTIDRATTLRDVLAVTPATTADAEVQVALIQLRALDYPLQATT